MKKIALLFTIVSAGQLYGMEPVSLPKKLQNTILQNALASSNTLDQAIEKIEKESSERNVLWDINDFADLVIILADKLNNFEQWPLYTESTTPYNIAEKFNMPIAKEYTYLVRRLRQAVEWSNDTMGMDMIFKPLLIEHPEIAKIDPQILFLAFQQARNNAPKVIELLLQHGANPNAINRTTTSGPGKTLLEYLNSMRYASPRDQQIKTLLQGG